MSKQAVQWILIVPALLSAIVAMPARRAPAGDGTLTAHVNLEYQRTNIENENENEASPDFGEKTETESSWLRERYRLELQKELYPYLRVLGGGYLELIDARTDSDGLKTGYEERTDLAYGELSLDNPLYEASGGYRRRRLNFDPRDLASTTVSREEISGLWHWRPVGLPSIDVDYNRFHTWDDEETRDTTLHTYVVKTLYSYKALSSDYTYTRIDQDEQIGRDGVLTQTHDAGLRYPKSFLGDRVRVTGSARFNYESLAPQDEGDVLLPATSPGSAFFLLDDSDPSTLTPVDATNPLSTVNIGRSGPTTDVGIGLNFGSPTEVDTIHVMPVEDPTDPNIASPTEIASFAGSFVWRVFSSDDQLNWTEHPVASVIYSIFDNRFEIVTSSVVDTPYIKVVTTPLTTITKDVPIQRIAAFTTVPGEPGLEIETFTQTYNVGVNWAATDKTSAYVTSLAKIRSDEPFGTRRATLTNSIGAEHEFSPIFTGNVRVLRSDSLDTERVDAVRHTYTAALIGDYLPSLNQRLVYSGEHQKEGGRSGLSNSVFLRTNADVYRDWAVNLDLGYAARDPLRGAQGSSATVRVATNIVPNGRLNFTIDYRGSYDTEEGRESGFSHIGRFQGFWLPIPTLSLSAVVSIRERAGDGRGLRDNQNYSVNWAPFPDGDLTFNLSYNQIVDIDDRESKILTPQVNWQITRTTLLTAGFDYGRIESDIETRDLRALRVSFRTLY